MSEEETIVTEIAPEGEAPVGEESVTVTQEFLDAHPELVEQGIVLGDTIVFEDEEVEAPVAEEQAPQEETSYV